MLTDQYAERVECECGFDGLVDVLREASIARWTCPDCGAEQERDAALDYEDRD